MYESQFRLKRRPFAATPDPRCFLPAEAVQAALDELVVCVEQGQGIAIVSAPAGTGKTLLCERLRTELDDRFEMIFLRHASFLTRRALLQTVLCELNHTYKRHDEQELRLELIPAIRSLNPHREALVLICDEAHLLTEDLLEELRILADLAETGRPLVRLVLVGQHGLEETLALPSMEALNQRIRAHICLDTFDRATSLDYIDYRITWGGGRTDEIFTPEALELICRASEGVPRRINQLCDHTLLLAYVAEQTPVTSETVREALQDLRQLPLHWNESLVPDFPADTDFSSDDRVEAREFPVQPVVSWESAESHPEMESVEIGADLPELKTESACVQEAVLSPVEIASEPTNLQTSSTIEPRATFEEEEFESTSVEESHLDREPTGQTLISSNPSRITAFKTMSVPPRMESDLIHPRSLKVIEEIVWDKYAAIDGGFTLPSAPITESVMELEIESTVSNEDWDTSKVEQVRMDLPVDQDLQETAIEIEDVARIELDSSDRDLCAPREPVSDGFDAVCERLTEWLPEVNDNPGWDRQSLGTTALSEETMAMTQDHYRESIEVELSKAVSEMINDVRAQLHRVDRNKTEPLPREAVLPAEADSIEAVDAVIEAPIEQVGEKQMVTKKVPETLSSTEPTPVTTASPPETIRRPFRNLFSMLRRKQQGLL